MSVINWPILYINDPLVGRPLFQGQIFVGKPDLDPEDGNGNPINSKQLRVVLEDGSKVDVGQPFILSQGGNPVYNGKYVRLDVDGNYSIKILNKLGVQTYYIDNVFEGQPLTELDIINDLSQAYEPWKTVAQMQADLTILPVGKKVSWHGYHAESDGGSNWGVVKSGAHTEDGGSIFTLADGKYVQANVKGGRINIRKWGAQVGEDATANFIAAGEFLLGKTDPGGTIYVNGEFNVNANAVNWWDILAAKQGITPADNYLPNGELVRGTYIGMEGDGYERSKLNVIGAGDGFTWGNFTAINDKRAMSGKVTGIDFRGVGVIGHTSQLIIDNGPQSYSTTTNPAYGTTNTDTRCLVFAEVVPNTFVENCRFRHFQEAVHQTYGFGFVADRNDIQFCNIGYFFDAGVTTWEVRSGNEIEFCAVGVYSRSTANGLIGAAVIEANRAGCDVLIWVSKFLTMDSTWFEGSLENVVIIGDQFAAATPNTGISISNAIGLNVRSNGGLTHFKATNCAMNLAGESFSANTGELFNNIVYEDCTLNNKGFDASSISVSGIATLDGIKIKGETVNGTRDNFTLRDNLVKKSVKASASSLGNNICFTLEIDNEITTGRIEIEGYWKTEPANDYQMYTFKYVGVISRNTGGAAVVTFLANESATTLYPATGTNIPNLPTLPNTTVIGAVGDTQEVTVEFALGTATSQTADTFYTATIMNQTDGIRYK